ncbi:MAG TPA: flagellar hook-associated protein FlgK [Burkholderiales bacterium]|jgi:flagellar hook-associated protein 1 FlgK|nr:flagellar hook-associated protein FlgK [Burkholderiales bacterium]
MSVLSIGISGLGAAQSGIATTSHNISNVNTPGYSRQQTVQTTNTPMYSGGGYFGQGVNIASVQRAYNGFLVAQVREAQSQSSQMDSLSAQLQNIDNLLADPSAGLSPMLDNLFSAVNTVSASPSDPASRQTLVASAQTLASGFTSLSTQLTSFGDQANAAISQSVSTMNADAAQLAQINGQIVVATAGGQPPNDLMDQRDALLQDMAKQARISVVPTADGGTNVFLGNGQALVLGSQQNQLAAQADPADPSQLTVGIMVGSTFQAFAAGSVSGGSIGAALAFRQTLQQTQNSLGRVAAGLAQSFNAQQDVGQDLNGNPGTDFFAVAGPQILGNSNNTGSASLSATISNYGALTTSDYKLAYDGTNYTLTRLSDNTQQTFASLPQTVDGVDIDLSSGTPAAGDSFLIEPTRAAAQTFTTLITDPNKVAAAFPVRAAVTSANSGSGTAKITGVTPPADPNVSQPVTITFTSATTFDISGTGTGNPTGLTYTPGMQISYNGWTATLAGAPANGDTFKVGPNTGGSGDNGNVNALANLQLAKILSGGTASFSDAYAQLVSNVGNQTAATISSASAQKSVLTNATSAEQSVSGVNLDEEAANLLKYQQAYQAASKVISTADAMFQSILSVISSN